MVAPATRNMTKRPADLEFFTLWPPKQPKTTVRVVAALRVRQGRTRTQRSMVCLMFPEL
jgi:hypothetical protein